MRTEQDVMNAFYDGMSYGVYLYAWMKDGVYYVGTTGKTLKEANKEIEEVRQLQLNNIKGTELIKNED